MFEFDIVVTESSAAQRGHTWHTPHGTSHTPHRTKTRPNRPKTYLGHRLLDQRLGAREPVAVGGVVVVGQVDRDEHAGGRPVNRHVVRGVVEELGPGVALNVVRVVVTPPELDVEPVLGGGGAVVGVLGVGEQRRLGALPLVGGKEQDVGARRVHLVRLARVDRLLLHRLDLQHVELLVKDLAQIDHHRLVDLLPQMRPEDLPAAASASMEWGTRWGKGGECA